jgi:hypothetical protein
MPGMPGKYECEYHPGVLCFEADEACKRCLKEDLEATPGSKVGNADRSGPGTLRADLSPTETGAP